MIWCEIVLLTELNLKTKIQNLSWI